jgi:hypothetical protein
MATPRQEDKSTQNSEDAARHTGERTSEQVTRSAQTAADTGEKMAQSGANLLQQNAEQTRRTGEVVAEAGQQMARAGANLLQQNAQTFEKVLRSGVDMTAAVMGSSSDQLSRTFGFSGNEAQEATERSARNAVTILHSSAAVTKGMSGMHQEYFHFVRHQLEKNMERMNELWRCRTPQDLAAVQTDFVRETMESALETGRRMADMSLRLAEDAANQMKRAA